MRPLAPWLVLLALLTAGCAADASEGDLHASRAAPAAGSGEGKTANEAPGADAGAPAADQREQDVRHVAPDRGPRIFLFAANGSITELGAGAADVYGNGGACCTYAHVDGADVFGTFAVVENATAVVAELAWDDEVADLDLIIRAPDFEWYGPADAGWLTDGSRGHTWSDARGQPTQGEGVAVLRLDESDFQSLHGRWTWEVRAKAAHETSFAVRVSVFYDLEVPDGYTALE